MICEKMWRIIADGKILYLCLFILFTLPLQAQTDPKVVIKDSHGTTDTVFIDCQYGALELTADYPEISGTNSYTVSPITYSPFLPFSAGSDVVISGYDESVPPKQIRQDVFSNVIDLPFKFCFYGTEYSRIIISDNGVVSFNTANAQKKCPYTIAGANPNSGLPLTSIFGVYHDMVNDELVNKVKTNTIGVAPFRKFIINFNELKQFSSNKTSTSQIVLYETTNIVDVYVKNKDINNDTEREKNSLIGIMNSTGSDGVSPANRNYGIWAAQNEAWRFTPTESTSISVNWYRQGSYIGDTNPMPIPNPQTGYYNVKVTYNNLCKSVVLCDTINVKLSLDFPIIQNVSDTICVQNGETPSVILSSYDNKFSSTLNISYYESYSDAQNKTNPITISPYQFTSDKTLYVRAEATSTCYSIAYLYLRLNKVPAICPSDTIVVCDEGNDNTENIDISTHITEFNSYYMDIKFYPTRADAENNTNEIINTTTYPFSPTPPQKVDSVFFRVWNKDYHNANCYNLCKIVMQLQPTVSIKNDSVLVCYVSKGNTYPIDLTTKISKMDISPAPPATTIKYYEHSNFSGEYTTPTSASITMNSVVYVKASAPGYCDGKATLTLLADSDCDEQEDEGGGGGGVGARTNCDADGSPITVDLENDYLKFYILSPMTNVSDIEFYEDRYYSTPITTPHTYTFTPSPMPYRKTIYAKYKLISEGTTIEMSFYISAVQRKELTPDTFNICDVQNDGTETISLSTYRDAINTLYYNSYSYSYPTILFFASPEDYDDYVNNNVNNSISSVTLTYPTNPKTVYAYVNVLGCVYQYKLYFNLVAIDEFVINSTVCDFNADNEEKVNLTSYNDEIKTLLNAGQIANISRIYYYTSAHYAHLHYSYYSIPSLFTVSIPTADSVVARVQFRSDSICPVLVKIRFTFTTAVDRPILQDINVCDIGNDNQEMVDLRLAVDTIFTNTDVFFYTSHVDAAAPNPAYLIGQYNKTTPLLHQFITPPNPQYVYVRVYDTNSGCATIDSIEVNLVQFPTVPNRTIKICDAGNDGTEVVDSTIMTTQLINDNSSLNATMSFYFYNTQSDADNDVSRISTFNATATNSVWVRITSNAGGCYGVFELTFDPTKSPHVVNLQPILICNNNSKNPNNTTNETVMLSDYDDDIVGLPLPLPAGYNFRYYSTNADADADINQLSATYSITEFPDTVFVRVDSATISCHSIGMLIFNQYETLDNAIKDTSIMVCSDGVMNVNVNLTEYPPIMVIAPHTLSEFAVTYHNTKDDAVNDVAITSDITNYYMTPSSSVFIKFKSNATGCYVIKKLDVVIYAKPKAQNIFLDICDNDDGVIDWQYTINLDSYKSQIITGEPNVETLYTFWYYHTRAEAEQDTNRITNPYTFLESSLSANTDTVWVRTTNTDGTGCSSYSKVIITILPKVPLLKNVDTTYTCSASSGISVFDLTNIGTITTASNPIRKYYPTFSDAQNATNEIAAPSAYTNVNPFVDSVFIRVAAATYCDNLMKLVLFANAPVTQTDTTTICSDELPYTWNGKIFTTAGTQSDTITLINGCDSISYMTLIVNEVTNTNDTVTVCSNTLPYIWREKIFNEAGTQSDTINSVKGCDSILNMTLFVNEVIITNDTTTICASALPYTWNGIIFTAADTQIDTQTSANGCDSIINMTLIVNDATYGSDKISACETYTWIDGNTYTENNNTAQFTLQGANSNGCDSIVTLDLTINHNKSTEIDTTINYGEIYDANGFYKTEEGIYTLNDTTNYGCDSIITLNLKVIPSIQMPNAIDPSDFTINPLTLRQRNHFGPIISGKETNYEYHMLIFNRWNTMIFETNKLMEEAINPAKHYWDGTFKGKTLSEDGYLYYIKINLKNTDNKFEKKGVVSIIYK